MRWHPDITGRSNPLLKDGRNQRRSSRSSQTAEDKGGFKAGIDRRNAVLPGNARTLDVSAGTSRATGLPRSVINTSLPLRTISISSEMLWRASLIPALFMMRLCYM